MGSVWVQNETYRVTTDTQWSAVNRTVGAITTTCSHVSLTAENNGDIVDRILFAEGNLRAGAGSEKFHYIDKRIIYGRHFL